MPSSLELVTTARHLARSDVKSVLLKRGVKISTVQPALIVSAANALLKCSPIYYTQAMAQVAKADLKLSLKKTKPR